MIRRLSPGATADEPGHRVLPTITIEETIVGVGPTHDDPTENYHEASRLYPDISDPRVRGMELIETSAEMRASTTRSTKRHPTAPLIRLPTPDLGGISLADALTRRRSRRSDASKRLGLPQLATLLGAAYGVTARLDAYGQAFRTAPSAGALYPLELYVATRLVDGLDQALFHYDPLRHALERLRPLDPGHELEPLAPYPELVRECAAVIVMTAMLWRSRFKYGARAYRFALMEAGHVGQNLMLAATALDLAVVPLGGFYDVRVDSLVDVDGVNEATIYLFAVATP